MYVTLRHPGTGEIVVVRRNEGPNVDLESLGQVGWEILGEHEYEPPMESQWTSDGWLVPMDVLRKRLRNRINFLRDAKQDDVCSTPAGVVQCDEKSKTKINGLVIMATLAKANGQHFEVEFTRADNTRVTLDADEMIALGVAVGEYVTTCHERATTLKDEVEAAQSPEDLKGIDCEAGWP